MDWSRDWLSNRVGDPGFLAADINPAGPTLWPELPAPAGCLLDHWNWATHTMIIQLLAHLIVRQVGEVLIHG